MVVTHCYISLNMTNANDKIFSEKHKVPPSVGAWPMSQLKVWVVALLEPDPILMLMLT